MRAAADEGEGPVRDLGGEGDQGGGADHAVGGDDRVEDALQVGVAARDDPAEQVAGAGNGVRLELLGDLGEPLCDGVVAAGLPDLQGDERGHLIAERGRVHLGPVPGDHAALPHPLQACLHGAAATRRRREASSTPTLGSAASSSISAASSRSITPRLLVVMVYSNTMLRSVLIGKMTSNILVGCAV